MRIIEALRERHQKKRDERPMRRKECGPIAIGLLDEIDAHIDVTPEFQKASTERKIENRATRLINRKPLEFDSSLGHFSISKGSWVEESGSPVRGAQIKFTPNNGTDDNLTIEVYHRGIPPHNPGVANEVYIWSPHEIGNFSLTGHVSNAPETRDAIKALLPKLFPALQRREKMTSGVSER